MCKGPECRVPTPEAQQLHIPSLLFQPFQLCNPFNPATSSTPLVTKRVLPSLLVRTLHNAEGFEGVFQDSDVLLFHAEQFLQLAIVIFQ